MIELRNLLFSRMGFDVAVWNLSRSLQGRLANVFESQKKLCVSDGNGADEGSYKVLSCASEDTRRFKNLLRVIL